MLYTQRTLRELFEKAGYQVELLEYFDEVGVFHHTGWSCERGTVRRSKRYDRRNQGGVLAYTSIILERSRVRSRIRSLPRNQGFVLGMGIALVGACQDGSSGSAPPPPSALHGAAMGTTTAACRARS